MSRPDVTPHLELTDVSKVYRSGKHAVDGLSLRLGPGLLGLLGPNGAGKSSLMRIIATVTRPTSGRLTYRGADVLAHPDLLRRELGFLPQDFGVHPHLTSREFLSYLAAAKGLPARAARARIDELLALVNLTEAVRRPLGAYSGGMLRRVGIAQALLGDPSVIVVDEPTAATRPGGTGALPQPAEHPRRGPGGAAVHPHRLRHRVGGRGHRDPRRMGGCCAGAARRNCCAARPAGSGSSWWTRARWQPCSSVSW